MLIPHPPFLLLPSGYVFWVVATSMGEVFTCATGDDGYAGGLATSSTQKREEAAAAMGRPGRPFTPGKVGWGVGAAD